MVIKKELPSTFYYTLGLFCLIPCNHTTSRTAACTKICYVLLIKYICILVLCAKFKYKERNIWKVSDIATKYPLIWDKTQLYVIAFPLPYLVKAGLSRVSNMLSKVCNRLDIVKRGNFRLSLTSIEPEPCCLLIRYSKLINYQLLSKLNKCYAESIISFKIKHCLLAFFHYYNNFFYYL